MKTIPSNCNQWLLPSLLAGALTTSLALAKEEFTEELHQVYPLTDGGQISLANVNGSVRISTWERAEVKLDAVKRTTVKAHLQEVRIEIDAKPDRLGILTKYPDSKSHFLGKKPENTTSVEYTLTVPRSVRLDQVSDVNGAVDIEGVQGIVKASTVNGALTVRGLAANAALSSVNGGLKASFASLQAVKSALLSTVNGAVDLNLPEAANADLSANTVNGRISGDIKGKSNWPVGSSLKTTLGQGGAKISVSTVNGGVRIHSLKAEN